MVSEEEINRLARRIQEVEMQTSGKYLEYYLRAKKMLEYKDRITPDTYPARPLLPYPLRRERILNLKQHLAS